MIPPVAAPGSAGSSLVGDPAALAGLWGTTDPPVLAESVGPPRQTKLVHLPFPRGQKFVSGWT